MKRRKLISCKSLIHVLEPLVGPETEVRVLEIAQHLVPEKLRARLMEEVAAIEEEGVHILFGYGLCGRALEGVVSAKSTLVLPRVDDCVGALLGSRSRHQELLKERSGCYFLEQHWLETELNIFVQATKGLERIPPEKRGKIVELALKHYTALALLDSGDTVPGTEARCLEYADRYALEFLRLRTELGLLSRLITGPWCEDEFIVCPPGQPTPFF
jgi:hypothetical protein